MIRRIFIQFFISAIFALGGLSLPSSSTLWACKSCSCKLPGLAPALEHQTISDAEWAQMVDFYKSKKRFEFPPLFRRMMMDEKARERITRWIEDDPTVLDDLIVGRHYKIPQAIQSTFELSIDRGLIFALLHTHNPPEGMDLPEEKRQIILNSLTTFGFLFFRYLIEHPEADRVSIASLTVYTEEMKKMLEHLGFVQTGSGMTLELKPISK